MKKRSKKQSGGKGFWGEVAKEFKKNKGAIIGLIIF